MDPFVHQQRAVRVVFRPGALADVADEVDLLNAKRVLLIGSPRHANAVADLLAGRVVGTETRPVMHVPIEQADTARVRADELGVDACVAVGGGSAVGLAKAVALHRRIPILAIPTTLSGSEMTRVWGLTVDGVKQTGKDPVVAPKTVLYDPDLLASLPTDLAVPSAVNALAHAVEALWAPDRTPVTDLLAAEAARALSSYLRQVVQSGRGDFSTALYGAWLAGSCLDVTTMSVHHKICHTLGGTFALPHAPTHTVVLPHAIAFNAADAPAAIATLSSALDLPDPAVGLQKLIGAAGGPTSLKELGLGPDDVDRATELCLASPYANPHPVTAHGIRNLLERALHGAAPLPGS